MKKFVCILFTLVLLASSAMIAVNAMPAPYYTGDANFDGDFNVKDATTVQKFVAKLIEIVPYGAFLADIDEDGEITVKDATLIQKDLAKITDARRPSYPDISYRGFYSSYDCGKAMAGVPVTFTAVASSVEKAGDPLTYEFYVNSKLIDKGSNNSFTYTFPKEGYYDVAIKCVNSFGFDTGDGINDYFEVVKPYESDIPVIKAFYPDQHSFATTSHGSAQGDVTYTAEAIFGKGDYQYEFLLDGKVIQEYSAKNTYVFTEYPDFREEPYVLTVRVKDSSTGDGFVSEDYTFMVVY